MIPLEWVGSVCGIVTRVDPTDTDPGEGYEIGDSEPCAECCSPVGAACVARVRAAEGCDTCGAAEVEHTGPRTAYACGGSDYDRRPGTGSCNAP